MLQVLLHTKISGIDHPLITSEFSGEEQLSGLYRFIVTVHSQLELDTNSLIDHQIMVKIMDDSTHIRYFHGIITQIKLLKPHDARQQRIYQLIFRPRFSKLQHNINSRIYTNKSVIDLIKLYCKAYDIHDYDIADLQESYSPLRYLTQYQESDYDFLQRYLARAGISYRFEFSADKHQLIFFDNMLHLPKAHEIAYYRPHQHDQASINYWQQQNRLTPQSIASQDYHYLSPKASLKTLSHIASPEQNHIVQTEPNECYQYPGYHQDQSIGQEQLNRQVKCLNWQYHQVNFQSTYKHFIPGLISRINNMANNTTCYIIHLKHQAHDHSLLSQHDDNAMASQHYTNQGIACSAHYDFAPHHCHWPHITHHITAMVAENPQQKIAIDSQGRLKVNFPGFTGTYQAQQDSCWLRVAQANQLQQSGWQFIPHPNQRVMIRFHNGDPEQPYIAGSEHSQQNNMPTVLSANGRYQQGFTSPFYEDEQLAHHVIFHDYPQQEQILLSTDGKWQQHVTQNLYKTQAQMSERRIEKNYEFHVDQGKSALQAHHIVLQVGQSQMIIDDTGIHFDAPNTRLLSRGSNQAKPLARISDHHKCNKILNLIPHFGGKITSGSPTVMINGRKAARKHDTAHCLPSTDHLKASADNIVINGRPAARLNDKSCHGGVITHASSNTHSGPHSGVSHQAKKTPKPAYWLQLNYPQPVAINLPNSSFAKAYTLQAQTNYRQQQSQQTASGEHNPYALYRVHDIKSQNFSFNHNHIANSEIIAINGKPLTYPIDSVSLKEQDYKSSALLNARPQSLQNSDRVAELTLLPPPIILNLREDNHEHSTSLLTKEQLNYFINNGNNALIFIHGYNVAHGEFKPQIVEIKDTGKYEASYEHMMTSVPGGIPTPGIKKKYELIYSPADSKQTVYRDIKQLQSAFPVLNKPDVLDQFDCLQQDQWLNGSGCYNWSIHMEDNINRAAGVFNGTDYRQFTRLLHIHWSGDANPAYDFSDSEDNADRAGLKLVPIIKQLQKAGIRVNIIAHSLGNRVLLKAMDKLGDSGDSDIINHVFLCEAAVPQTALSDDPTRDISLKGNGKFVNAHLAAKKISVLYSQRDAILRSVYWFSAFFGMTPDEFFHRHDAESLRQHYIDTLHQVIKDHESTYKNNPTAFNRYMINVYKKLRNPLTTLAHEENKTALINYVSGLHGKDYADRLWLLINDDDFEQMLKYNAELLVDRNDKSITTALQKVNDFESKLDKRYKVTPALGYVGPDIQDPFIEQLIADEKLIRGNTTDAITSHSAMKIRNNVIMNEFYKKWIFNKKNGISQLGTSAI